VGKQVPEGVLRVSRFLMQSGEVEMGVRHPRILGEGVAVCQNGLAFAVEIFQEQRQVVGEQGVSGETRSIDFFGRHVLAAQMQQSPQIDSRFYVVCIERQALAVGGLRRLRVFVFQCQGAREVPLCEASGVLCAAAYVKHADTAVVRARTAVVAARA
jgi:hypothetical protein